MKIERLTPADYAEFRQAGKTFDSTRSQDAQVREFIVARDEAEAAAEAARPKRKWVRDPHFVHLWPAALPGGE